MSAKQDRQGARTASDIERKYNFGKTFAELMGIATDAQKAAEEAQNATENLDKELTAEEIFNRLTNNGEVQGIYRDEKGDIYLNASYIKSGEFLADLIKVGVLQSKDGKSFYLDLENGILKGQFDEFSVSGKTVETIAQEKVSAQTQTDIFNKLTNNGALKGLYMKNNDLFINASYIKSGKIVTEGSTYLRPTYEDCMNMLWSLNSPTNFPPKDFYDLNGDGEFTITDVLLALSVCYGKEDISKCVSLNKSIVIVTIEPSNPLETVKISGTNMWGSEVSVSLGANITKIPVISGNCVVGGALAVNEFAEITKLAVTVGGDSKNLSWKDNGDGTYTLIGS